MSCSSTSQKWISLQNTFRNCQAFFEIAQQFNRERLDISVGLYTELWHWSHAKCYLCLLRISRKYSNQLRSGRMRLDAFAINNIDKPSRDNPPPSQYKLTINHQISIRTWHGLTLLRGFDSESLERNWRIWCSAMNGSGVNGSSSGCCGAYIFHSRGLRLRILLVCWFSCWLDLCVNLHSEGGNEQREQENECLHELNY